MIVIGFATDGCGRPSVVVVGGLEPDEVRLPVPPGPDELPGEALLPHPVRTMQQIRTTTAPRATRLENAELSDRGSGMPES